jgi:hypothetical protein
LIVRERERQRGDLKHLSVHQWIRFAIPDSQQPASPIGFLFLKLPPPPCAVLLVYNKYILHSLSWQITFIEAVVGMVTVTNDLWMTGVSLAKGSRTEELSNMDIQLTN